MRDMEAFLLIAMHESIAVRKEERSSTEVLASPFPRGLNLLRVRTGSSKRLKSGKKLKALSPVHGFTTVQRALKGKRYRRSIEIVTTGTAIYYW